MRKAPTRKPTFSHEIARGGPEALARLSLMGIRAGRSRSPRLAFGNAEADTNHETAAMTKPAPDSWPQTAQLILLAFDPDTDIADLACKELLDRIDTPAIPLAHEDGRRRVIRRTEASP